MKIQIEPRKDIIDIKPSLEKITYVSYQNIQEVISKAPEDVKLSDVKNALPETADLEHYYKTKDSIGNIIHIEVDNDNQSIPLLDGMIEVETFPRNTQVEFRIRDEYRNKIRSFCFAQPQICGVVPISMKKSKTLKDVKEAIPAFVRKIFEEGKSIKYFFRKDTANHGIIHKELILDTEEIPFIEGKETIICWIKVSSDVSQKLGQLANRMWLKLALSIIFAFSLAFCSQYFDPSGRTPIIFLVLAIVYTSFVMAHSLSYMIAIS